MKIGAAIKKILSTPDLYYALQRAEYSFVKKVKKAIKFIGEDALKKRVFEELKDELVEPLDNNSAQRLRFEFEYCPTRSHSVKKMHLEWRGAAASLLADLIELKGDDWFLDRFKEIVDETLEETKKERLATYEN